MSLGSFFPDALKKQRILSQLKPGVVIKHKTTMDDGQVHEKRFVVLSVSGETLTCVINSELSNFIKIRPFLLACQVQVACNGREFLEWDSYIDCSRVRTYSTAEVVAQLLNHPEWIYGNIDGALRTDILHALSQSEAIEPAVLKVCCTDLTSVPLP